MKQHAGATGRLAVFRSAVQRFTFFLLVVLSLALMLVGRADTRVIERTRMAVLDAVAPVLDVLSRPAVVVAEVAGNVRELAQLRAENERLRRENQRLLHWQIAARRLEGEMRVLREQLSLVTDRPPRYVTGRVIADLGGSFVHAMLVGAGSQQGVRKGQAAIAGDVLVGRVVEVGERSARIVLLTDMNARVPVIVESSRAKAMLAGDNTSRPLLNYLAENVSVSPGDHVVTSGHGGAFPPGIPVGVVASVAEEVVRVEPFVERHRLEFVTLVDYSFPGLDEAAPAADAGTAVAAGDGGAGGDDADRDDGDGGAGEAGAAEAGARPR